MFPLPVGVSSRRFLGNLLSSVDSFVFLNEDLPSHSGEIGVYLTAFRHTASSPVFRSNAASG
jgi:hypothetical protein